MNVPKKYCPSASYYIIQWDVTLSSPLACIHNYTVYRLIPFPSEKLGYGVAIIPSAKSRSRLGFLDKEAQTAKKKSMSVQG